MKDPADREKAREFLDTAIRNWRRIRSSDSDPKKEVAPCYVDAYQCARLALLGELLPLELSASDQEAWDNPVEIDDLVIDRNNSRLREVWDAGRPAPRHTVFGVEPIDGEVTE